MVSYIYSNVPPHAVNSV